MPAVVFVLGFAYNWKTGGYDYLEYMSRPEAFEKTKHLSDEYKDFIDYMSNSEKSDGLFDSKKDFLSEADKDRYRSLEKNSKEEGCPKYFGVISFDNNFLIENGLMNSFGAIDSKKLKEVGRAAVNTMIDKSDKLKNNNVFWNAAIHTNTDNVHIHYSICEYHRLENRLTTRRDKDALEVEAFDALKSKVVSKVYGNEQVVQLTRQLRQQMLPEFRNSFKNSIKQLCKLRRVLPKKVPLQYNGVQTEPYRIYIDSVTDAIVRDNPTLRLQYEQYCAAIDKSMETFRKIYGEGKRHLYTDFRKNRIADFYSRTGNILLKELSEFEDDELSPKTSRITCPLPNSNWKVPKPDHLSVTEQSSHRAQPPRRKIYVRTDLVRAINTLRRVEREAEEQTQRLMYEFDRDFEERLWQENRNAISY